MSSVSWSVSGGEGEGPSPVFLAPPPEELCRPVPDSFVLARTSSTAVLVQAIRVYSTGCLLDVEWIRRRRDESDDDWDLRQQEAHEFLMDQVDAPDGIKIRFDSSESGSGSVSEMGARLHSDEVRIVGKLALWLTPLPTEPRTRLICSWERYGIEDTAHDLDVAAVRDAADRAARVWT